MANLPKGQGVVPMPPFMDWLATNIPAVYDNTMSYYDELTSLIKYLQDSVVPALNADSEAITILSNFVEHYFDNLDVQEEINNKLDAMAQDGTLSEMVALVIGYTEVYPESFGAVGDGETDDTQALQDTIDYAYEHKVNVHLQNKTYIITEPLLIYGNPDPAGKATEIIGNGIGKSIIKKTTNTAKTDYAGNSYDCALLVSKVESSDGALHNIRVHDLTLLGTDTSAYGIAAKMSCAGAEFKSLSVEGFVTAGLYFNGNTYLNRFIQIRARYSTTGFYIYGGINTSNVIANCYAVNCTNGYKVSGLYSQMDSPACDGATGIVYDLENYRGTVISAGSESNNATTVFRFNSSACTLINPVTFPNFDNADAFHIQLGSGSHVTVIGGRLMWDAQGTGHAAKGGFVDNGYSSSILIQNTLVGDYEKKSTAYSTAVSSVKTIQSEYGTVNTFGDERIIYIGADGRSTSGLIKTGKTDETLQSNAIFMGGGYDKNQTYTDQSLSSIRSPILGDLFLSKRPNEIGGIGWVQTASAIGENWKTATMKKIPIIHSGATADRPIFDLEIGQQYYDTTLNQPVWVKAIGGVCSITFSFPNATTSAGTINFSMFGTSHSIEVEAGESVESMRQKFLAVTNPQYRTVDLDASRVRYIYRGRKHFDSGASSIDNGTTGAGITIARDGGTDATWVDATGTTA